MLCQRSVQALQSECLPDESKRVRASDRKGRPGKELSLSKEYNYTERVETWPSKEVFSQHKLYDKFDS